MYLKITNIRKRYDGENIIDKVSAIIGSNERVGLIGRNGSGKTTLLKIIAGLEPPTSGSILKDPKDARVGYHQQVMMETTKTIKDFIIASIPQVGEIYVDMQSSFTPEKLALYEANGGFVIEGNIPRTLRTLGLSKFDDTTPISSLSGGEKTRLQLAPIIIDRPAILLLDEPTNHLDVDGLEFLETYLKAYKGIVIMASHDEAFLLNTATRIMEIDHGKVLDIKGGFESFLREKEFMQEKELFEYKEKRRELQKLTRNLETFRQAEFDIQTDRGEHRKDNDKMGYNFLSEKAANKYARRAEVTSRKIKDYENLQKPQEEWQMKLDLDKVENRKLVFHLEDVSKSFDDLAILRNITLDIYSDEKTCLIGKNGSGKTTLLKILNGEILPDSGTFERNDTIRIGYLSQDHLEIAVEKTLLQDFLDSLPVNESKARTYLHKFLFKDDEVYRQIATFSQGEKAKYAFAKMLFGKPQFLLLDEPTNYMDMESKHIIIQTLKEFSGGFIIATHDRNLIHSVGTSRTINLSA